MDGLYTFDLQRPYKLKIVMTLKSYNLDFTQLNPTKGPNLASLFCRQVPNRLLPGKIL